MTTDSLDRLRGLALEGLAPAVPAAPRRRRATPGAPALPAGAVAPNREELPAVLRDAAEVEWRRAVHAWTPSLERLHSLGVERVRVVDRVVEVRMRNATHRARALAPPQVPVVVAWLVGLELPAVRRALRAGVTEFAAEGSEIAL